MSRNKAYQKLLNSKEWKRLRARKLAATNHYCEICYAKGYRNISALAVDVHHIVPVESAQTAEEMRRLCFDWNNLQALCVKHHIEAHAQVKSHSKEAHKQREEDRLQQWIARHRKPPPAVLSGRLPIRKSTCPPPR